MKNVVKLFDPVIDSKEELSLKKILQSHFWSSGLGHGNVSKFEKEFKKFTASCECVAVNSGSAALHLALSLLEIRNKEVILPSLTFVSTAHAIILNGGTPVFVDIDSNSLCIDPELIKQKISKKTKAIIPVHFGGMPANLNEIIELCKNNRVQIVEDAAHATGTIYNKKPIGCHSFAVCHSFNPTKNLAMPNGGAITINAKNSKELKTKLNSRRWCGISNRIGAKYDVEEEGWNYFMNEFSAAMGLIQLKKIKKLISKRRKIAKIYASELKIPKRMNFDNNCSYHLYWVQVKKREEFMKSLSKNKIETGIHFLPVHQMKLYNGKFKLPITEDVGKHIVSLPMHPNLTENQVTKVIHFANKYT
jgi:dTDP-4-amino-4,6-dideoxygalactose transaminase